MSLDKDFIRAGGLAAYIQAGVSVLAFLLALSAYNSWKDQELARRKADLATSILRDVHAAADCMNNVRRYYAINEPAKLPSVKMYLDMSTGRGAEKLKACGPIEAALKAHSLMSSRVLDERLGERITAFGSIFTTLSSAQDTLRFYAETHGLEALKPSDTLPFERDDEGRIVEYLNILGMRTVPTDLQSADTMWSKPDEFGAEIERWRNLLDEQLRPYLRLQ
jgi:hypothetical protein